MTCSRGDATVFGLRNDAKTITVTTLKDPANGGPSRPPIVATRLPFAVHAIAAITASTLFVTDAKGALYELDLAYGPNGAITASRQKVATGWAYDRITYDGQGHVYGLDGTTLDQHALGTAPLTATGSPVVGAGSSLAGGFTVGPAHAIGNYFDYATLAGTADGWLLATTSSGEWDAIEISSDKTPTVTLHFLGISPHSYLDLAATTAGAYYGRAADGSLTWFLDSDPTSGDGSGISGGKTIDASGWTNLVQMSAVPATCGTDLTAVAQDGPRTVGRTRSTIGFGDGWCTEGAAQMFHLATGMWMDIHGDAWAWADSARRARWTVVAQPQPRSVIVFQPNVQIGRDHAGSLGHVAWVESVQQRADGAWLFIHEMNAYGGRGGWDTRWIKYNASISAATQEPANQFILAP